MNNRIHRGTALLNQLEELVLDVLREAELNDETLGPTEICKRAGISLEDANSNYRDWGGSGILNVLEATGRVRRLHRGKREIIGD